MSAVKYHLIIRPEQDELVELAQELAEELLGASLRDWSEPTEKTLDDGRTIWVSSQKNIVLRMSESTDDGRSGWLELSGFPDQGSVRWVLDEPPRIELKDLSEQAVDHIWETSRQRQAEAVRKWVRTRQKKAPPPPTRGGFKRLLGALRPGARSQRVPEDLPHVAQPPFAPDDFPTWLFKGELSSLGRRVPAVGKILAGVASDVDPEKRLLIRPLHRLGSQSIVPITMMRRGHTFAARTDPTRTFESIDALLEVVLPALGKYAGADLGSNPVARTKTTSPQAVFISRLSELEHGARQPFKTSAALQKIPGSNLVLRVLEVTTDFAAPGARDGLQEVEISGLPSDVTLFIVGHRHHGQWAPQIFSMGPKEFAEDVLGALGPALTPPPPEVGPKF